MAGEMKRGDFRGEEICSQEWKVQYTNMKKCVLKDSKISLSGTYEHPAGLNVTETFWTVNPAPGKSISLLDLPDYRDRVQFFQNKERMFFLKFSDVTLEDEGMYCIRIVTTEEKQRYLGYPGIQLNVTELRVEIPEEIVERQSPVLFCITTCDLSDKTDFIWYKNGKHLSESIDSNQLMLQSVRSDDSGNYSCAVSDQKHLPSPVITLSVRYPPKSVSVSISPSAEIVEGDSVTLICSSDSNPPALNFSWFKENQTLAIGFGQSFSISSFNSSHSGLYYCKAQNKYGSERSASVSITPAGRPKPEHSRQALYAAAGIGAALICICVIIVIKIMSRKSGVTGVQGGVSKQASPEQRL
ncbi:B-cell receptor CD22-like, partial [Garra rufa]|uniref:B-cell receptor CD22-like n=1 Tax=Garra rufa TaxID=137080 RepID=UPI003CCE5EC7